MARQVLPIVGLVVGAYFGNPQLGYAIGAAIGNAVDPLQIQGPKIGDVAAQTSSEGVYQPIYFGTAAGAGNMIAQGPNIIKKVKEKQGKGGPVTVSERLYKTFAIRIGVGWNGPITGVSRIWEDEKLVYDIRPGSTIAAESAKFALGFRLYLGSEDQLPDPDLEAISGIGNTPSYAGRAYIVFPKKDITDRRSISSYRFEVNTESVVEHSVWNADDMTSAGMLIDEGRTFTTPGIMGLLFQNVRSVGSATTGKVYWEIAVGAAVGAGRDTRVGFADSLGDISDGGLGEYEESWGWCKDGSLANSSNFNDGTFSPAGLPWDSGDVLQIALDLESNECFLGVNGTYGTQQGGVFDPSNPSTGLGPVTFPVNNNYAGSAPVLAAAMVLSQASPPQSRLTIRTRTEEFEFEVPAGYQPLGGSSSVETGNPVPLSSIVSAIHGFTAQSPGRYDVSDLFGIMVDGLILSGGYTGADAIRTLAGIYFFDSPECDKKIRHARRGKPVVHTFTFDDLVDEPEESTREQAIEYPKKLHLDYQNAVIEYAPAKATSSRESQDIRVVGEASLQAPVVMTADLAAQKSAILHKISWADADGEVTFSVPDKFLSLVPSDCVGLALRGSVRRLRIDKMEYNPGSIKLFTRNDRQSAYTTNVTGVPVPTPTPPPPSITGPSEIEVLDIPALLDLHDQPAPVRYIAVGGLNPAWYGAAVQESLDSGANYSGLIDNFSPGTLMGTLLSDVTDASPHYTDNTNVLHIQFDDVAAEIDSLTDSQFLSEGGALAVENADGSWEVMQYRDADDLGDGEYTLSHLLRGRLNTETQAHLAGRRVVVLDGVRVVSTQSSYIGQSIVHRAISFGTAPETGATDTITYEAKSQQEWPIASFTAERVSDTITGNIVPRHRFGTDDNPVRSTNWAGYRITYEEGGNVNSIVTLSDDFSLDVTGYGSPVDVTISQLNRITGAGPSVTESIA